MEMHQGVCVQANGETTYCWTWRKGSSSLVEDIILNGGGLVVLVRPSASLLGVNPRTTDRCGKKVFANNRNVEQQATW